jgi:hypothetical protein
MEQNEESPVAIPGSFSIDPDKSLAQWRFEIKTIGKKHWNKYYYHFLGDDISNYKIFYRSLKLYGDMNVFEAVLFAARQSVEGDPLNYVLKIAHNLWKEEQKELDKEQEYDIAAQAAIKESRKRNQELAKKLNQVRR